MKKDIRNKKFNRLTVLYDTGRRTGNGNSIWKCKCECGNYKDIRRDVLLNGNTKSCGCLSVESAKRTHTIHGKSRNGNLTYKSWYSMKRRCLDEKYDNYKYYGGRGIQICERWMKFENFLADMGERPEGMTIDRINNDGNYEPSNCKWSTKEEQNRNRRICKLYKST
jgi:hypothetical protein